MKKTAILAASLLLLAALLLLPALHPSRPESETIYYHSWALNRSDLSPQTLSWLERYNQLSPEEQMCISFIPPEIADLCGLRRTDSPLPETAP